jgi:hypothetical protein
MWREPTHSSEDRPQGTGTRGTGPRAIDARRRNTALATIIAAIVLIVVLVLVL